MVIKVINTKKRKDFDEFCSRINRFTSMSYMWNTMRIFKNVKKNINWNTWTNKNREEEIRKGINKLAPPSAPIEPKKIQKKDTEITAMETDFSMKELTRAISMIRRNSAPGRDGIEYRMIKELPNVMKKELLQIFNEIWRSESFPKDWRSYQVLFIDKPGKEKVRPIALSSCVGKIMERMVNERLVWWTEKNSQLAKDQNGFRRGRSCAENLCRITSDIKAGMYRNKFTLAAFLDVTSTYDNVIYDILMDKLEKIGCPNDIRRFINKWLYYRNTEFVIDNKESIDRIIFKGLPQGAVLSPILYAIFTGDITENLDEGIKTIQFADDIAVYTVNRDRNLNKEKLEQAVNTIGERLSRIGLSLEPKKTVLVEYSKYGKWDRSVAIEINGTTVNNEREAKFLGIWLDNRLNFHKQVREVKGRVNKANSLMTYLNKKSKGMEVNTAMMMYKSLVRSITDYGNFLYYPREGCQRIKLERAQFLGLRTALGYRNSTPNNVVIAESKVRLIRDRAALLARNFLSKTLVYGEEELINSVEELSRAENYARYRQPGINKSILIEAWARVKWIRRKVGDRRKYEIFDNEYEVITEKPEVNLDIGEYRKTKGSDDNQLLERIQDKYSLEDNARIIYTDGSKKKKGIATGASIVIEEQEIAYNISMAKECSIFTAEAFAIKAALEIIYRERNHNIKDIAILSDARSVLQALTNNQINVYQNRYITEIKKIHYKLKKELDKRIIYIWIPAHVGIKGNELADK